jgi:hypothetical protein
MRRVLRWAEFLWMHHGVYTSAVKRSVRYFLNDIEFYSAENQQPVSHEEKQKWKHYLKDEMNILDTLANVGDNYIHFGNSFTSLNIPIRRELVCKCGTSQPIQKVDYKFENFEFSGFCPSCKKTDMPLMVNDHQGAEEADKLTVIHWNPEDIVIDHCAITDTSEYFLDPSKQIAAHIMKGDRMYLENAPWDIIMAIKDQKMFKFNSATFKHLKTETAPTMKDRLAGWGLPAFMANFEQVLRLQILYRYNEAIALDYLVPFRVISPPEGKGVRDPMLSLNMGSFMGNVKQMIQQHKIDPTTWHTLPFPLQYQTLSGEARDLAPVELIDRAMDELLTSMDIPGEFYRNSLGATAGMAPISLRMFEKSWTHFTRCQDEWLNWFLDQISRIKGWENVKARLIRTSVYEDEATREVKLNLAAAGQISKRTAYRSWGIDPDYEREQLIDEQRMDQEAQQEEAKKLEQADMLTEQLATPPPVTQETAAMMAQQGADPAAAGGGMAPPPMGGGAAAPLGSGLGTNASLDDLEAEAAAVAQQIMMMDMSTRNKELRNLKQQNETLHALVKQALTDLESQASSQGVQAARQGMM